MPRTNSVRGQGSPPKGFISQTWEREMSGLGFGKALVLVKEIRLPFGDPSGRLWFSLPRVSWTSSFVSRFVRKRFETRPFFSLSICVFTQAAHSPSGEIFHWKAFSADRISSGVQGVTLPGAAWEGSSAVVKTEIKAKKRPANRRLVRTIRLAVMRHLLR